MLQLHNAGIQLGEYQALTQINFSLKAGEFVGILGANGAGKTTLLATLAGDLHPDHGTATLDGQPLGSINPRTLAQRRAVLSQTPTLNFDLSVHEVVAMGAYPWPELSPAELETRINHCLTEADAQHLLQRRFPTLSGGEALRVQFARLLLQISADDQRTERYLLLDEPTANLDPRHQAQILSVARKLSEQGSTGVIASLHDVNLAARWCDRLVLLHHGHIVAQGTPIDTLTPANLAKLYDITPHCMPHPFAKNRPLVLFD